MPYNFGEQFAEVYRLHAGIPQDLAIRRVGSDEVIATVPTAATREQGARQTMESFGLTTVLNSLAYEKMPALINNNYAPMLTEMSAEGSPVFDLAAADVLRARERGVPQYNQFRREIGLPPIERFEDLEADATTTAKLKELYGDDPEGVERLDLIVGTLCEGNRPLHGFGQTLFAVFVQFASGRLQRDPWFSSAKYNDRYLTREGIRFIDDSDLRGTILALSRSSRRPTWARWTSTVSRWCTTPSSRSLDVAVRARGASAALDRGREVLVRRRRFGRRRGAFARVARRNARPSTPARRDRAAGSG